MTSDTELPQDTPDSTEGPSATDRIVAAFGGIRPMAHKLGTPVTTVQGWKKRGAIPTQRHQAIRTAATAHGIDLDDAMLSAAAPTDTPFRTTRTAPTSAQRETSPAAPDTAQTEAAPAPTEPGPEAVEERLGAAAQPQTVSPQPKEPKSDPRADGEPAPQPQHVSPQHEEPESEPRSDGEPVPEPPRGRRGTVVAWMAIVLALLSVGLVVSAPLWIDSAYRLVGLTVPSGTGPAFDPNRLDALERRLASLERQSDALAARSDPDVVAQALRAELEAITGRVEAMEAIDPQGLDDRITAIGGAVDALTADIARMDGVLGSQRIALTEARSIVTSLEARADAVDDELEELAATQARDGRRIERLIASDSATQALVLAIGQLRVAIDAGQPYQQPLSALKALSAGVDEMVADLAALEPRAATGIPDRDALNSAFPDMAQAVRQAVLLPSDAGWVDRTVARIEGLVTIRPAPGEVDGEDAAAVLARAESRLNNGDLAGALAAIELLNGEAAEAAASWRNAAESRLAAEAALEHLTSFAIARLANTDQGRAAP